MQGARCRVSMLCATSGLRNTHDLLRKVHIRLPGKGDSNFHGARPVHLIIAVIKWIRTRMLSIHKSLSMTCFWRLDFRVQGSGFRGG